MSDVPELTPTEFRRRWPGPLRQGEVVLLDVREAAELEIAKLPEARHIPMREVPGRTGELSPDETVVVMCHSGVRSARVAQFLAANGFGRVFNLRGGIDAWSVEVDPGVPRY